MILVYSDSEIIDLDWIPNIQFPDAIQVCHSFEEYRDASADSKIAFTTHRLHCDHDINCTAYQGFEDKINQLSAISQLVFTIESELHNYHWQIWERCHHDNVYWLLPGTVNDVEDMINHIIIWGDWFKTTANIYKALPHKVAEITPYTSKPKYFDALLGSPKPHRDFVFNNVHSSDLADKFIMTYGGDWKDDTFYAQDYFIWEENTIPKQKIIGTADFVDYHGQHAHLSQVIPINVYNETAYSIIAETDHDNTLSCFTEKTAKAMIARRMFVAFSGYKFLFNLRRLGFKTFADVVDESYDLINDDETRYRAAFEQVKYLCNTDQRTVIEKIKPVLEYNYNLIMTRNWTTWSTDQITDLIQT